MEEKINRLTEKIYDSYDIKNRVSKKKYQSYEIYAIIQKLGKLEDILEKWQIKNEDLDEFLKYNIAKRRELNNCLYKMEKDFVNLKEKISKFKYGQTVWCVFPDNEFRKGFIFDEEFVGFNKNGIICKINDLDFFNFDEVFETKEEAIEKLEQLRRNLK